MSKLFANVRSDFHIVGELLERRYVTSEKQKGWELHILKIAGKGCTLEVQVPKDVYEGAQKGAAYQVTGSITVESGRTKLIAESVTMLAEVVSSGRAAS
jgi:hypothetical protein